MNDYGELFIELLAIVTDDDWTNVLHPAWFTAQTDTATIHMLAARYGVEVG